MEQKHFRNNAEWLAAEREKMGLADKDVAADWKPPHKGKYILFNGESEAVKEYAAIYGELSARYDYLMAMAYLHDTRKERLTAEKMANDNTNAANFMERIAAENNICTSAADRVKFLAFRRGIAATIDGVLE